LKQHHTGQRPPRPLLAVRRAARRVRHQPAALQNRFRPGIAQNKPVLGLQSLVKVLDREIPVAGPILLHHEFDAIHRRPPTRSPPAPSINQTLRPLRLVAVAQPTEMPLAYPQQLGRLHTAQPPASISLQCLHIPRHPYLGPHPDPPVWNSPKNRTDRLLPNPDISSATDRIVCVCCGSGSYAKSLGAWRATGPDTSKAR